MAKALNPFAPFWYTPRDERELPNPTKFKIRGLDGAEQGYVGPELTLDESKRMVTGMTGKGLDLTLRYALLDWENFSNAAGPVAYSTMNFGLIAHALRVELAMKILAASFVSEAEKKISSSP